MTQKRSAGLLLHRPGPDGTEVLLGHMGGPLWERRDAAAWSIPKGEYGPAEAPQAAARREFEEELGRPAPPGPYVPLGEVRQANGKLVTVWAVAADFDPARMRPGTFTMEWPPGSGRREEFPELDRVAWFTVGAARGKLVAAQTAFLDRLSEHLAEQPAP
ncbi:NUDIX domain-containing protein [Streptomyces bambusae]|uniref:NUDIX domain-containing protein n=1 Tax=Streptomyces bambusae TaxID=1550616 RepID=UPI001CFD7E4B|nr:NUDIX domain-containing protein [Streptomyces bambusae]MCB5166730.1 NUDIX domain-containing protein [Streptomyces bambusae]